MGLWVRNEAARLEAGTRGWFDLLGFGLVVAVSASGLGLSRVSRGWDKSWKRSPFLLSRSYSRAEFIMHSP